MAHVLSRAIGTEESLSHDAFRDEAIVGDVYLLCSDGLTKVISHEAIAARLTGSPARAVEGLIADTLAAGAPDNVSVIVISLEQPTIIAAAQN
jgi:serine/threonine protein phosphatase PrpC